MCVLDPHQILANYNLHVNRMLLYIVRPFNVDR